MNFYLIYTSKPRVPMTLEVVEEITQTSIRNNKQNGITGMLLAIEGHYLQFLEGKEKDVLDLLNKIKADARHKELVVWVKGYREERVFEQWSMGSWMLSNEALKKTEGLEDLRNFIRNPANADVPAKKFIVMMNGLLKTWIAHEPERVKKLQS
ncbi:BLUF domain-containing protein [Ekhidna sp.]|uniref:BLUF domain-containing protein n=1 Tax=Ekhidna sp. TaxID=2608089 RepID=UPI003CCB81FB